MAKSASAKGSYYKTRTKDWLEKQGYAVAFMERMMWVRGKPDPMTGEPKLFPVKKDQFGADLLAMDGESLVFVQVKLNHDHVAAGVREFAQHPFPPFAKRWLVVWTPRQREPEIIDCAVEADVVETLPRRASRATKTELF